MKPVEIPEKNRTFGPDLIRATAIVLVLLAHTIPDSAAFPLLGVLRDMGGVWGVEIFFVLSGYLIGGILMDEFSAGRLNTNAGLYGFWKRRWFRTLPNYYLFLAIYMVTYRIGLGRSPQGWESYLVFGQAVFWPHPTVFIIAWSLAIEEWFYVLFPVLLLVFSKYVANHGRAILATVLVFLVLPPVFRCFVVTDDWITGVRMMTLPRLDAIGYGVGLVYLKRYHSAVWNLMVKWWPVGTAICVAIFAHACVQAYFLGRLDAAIIFYRVFYFCLISLSIVMLFPRIAIVEPAADWWPVVVRKLSLWSYSLYLSHVFCLKLSGVAFKLAGVETNEAGLTTGIKVVVEWALAISISAAVYNCYEKPFLNLRDRFGTHTATSAGSS